MLLLLYREESLLTERQRVDRRRMEDAFFQYALLRATSWYPQFSVSALPLHSYVESTLSKFTCAYHGAFMEKYASKYTSTLRYFRTKYISASTLSIKVILLAPLE